MTSESYVRLSTGYALHLAEEALKKIEARIDEGMEEFFAAAVKKELKRWRYRSGFLPHPNPNAIRQREVEYAQGPYRWKSDLYYINQWFDAELKVVDRFLRAMRAVPPPGNSYWVGSDVLVSMADYALLLNPTGGHDE